MSDLSAARWVKSSFSAGGDNNRVEVVRLPGGGAAVRDFKTAAGTVLVVGASAWRAIVNGAGSFGA